MGWPLRFAWLAGLRVTPQGSRVRLRWGRPAAQKFLESGPQRQRLARYGEQAVLQPLDQPHGHGVGLMHLHKIGGRQLAEQVTEGVGYDEAAGTGLHLHVVAVGFEPADIGRQHPVGSGAVAQQQGGRGAGAAGGATGAAAAEPAAGVAVGSRAMALRKRGRLTGLSRSRLGRTRRFPRGRSPPISPSMPRPRWPTCAPAPISGFTKWCCWATAKTAASCGGRRPSRAAPTRPYRWPAPACPAMPFHCVSKKTWPAP